MYDAIIIGGGPAGYACALKVAQLGGKPVIVEKGSFGGTCTHRGCIPTKFLHAAASIVRKNKKASNYGIEVSQSINFPKTYEKMLKTVKIIAKGVEHLLKQNNIETIIGEAKILSQDSISVNGKEVKGKNIVIATGGSPISLPGIRFDEHILSSDSILAIDKLPESLTIVGGGYIGCEFASIFSELGVKVNIVEMLPRLLPAQDEEVSKLLQSQLEVSGVKVYVGSKVQLSCNTVLVEGKKLETEKILIAIGRAPNIDESLKSVGIDFDKSGITVNERMQTSVDGIYAIGDVAGKGMLAHSAYEEAMVAASNIMGTNSIMDYSTIPECIFTFPEIGSVGNKEGEVGRFDFAANSKATILGDRRGFVKIWSQDGVLVGATIIGPSATDLIGEMALAVKNKMKVKDLTSTIHPHPTLVEILQEAARNIEGRALHS